MRTKPTIPPRHGPIPTLHNDLYEDANGDDLKGLDLILADARVMGAIIVAFSLTCAFTWWVLS